MAGPAKALARHLLNRSDLGQAQDRGGNDMKRSFYEVLNIQPDADREQIDAAYARATAALEAGRQRRGTVDSAIEWNLLQDGYQILSHPVRRARYDAKLAAEASSMTAIPLPRVEPPRRKPRLMLAGIVMISVVFSGLLYAEIVQRVDEVQFEHRQAVARKKEEQNRPVTVDPARLPKTIEYRGNEQAR